MRRTNTGLATLVATILTTTPLAFPVAESVGGGITGVCLENPDLKECQSQALVKRSTTLTHDTVIIAYDPLGGGS